MNDEIDSITGNNTWVLDNLSLDCILHNSRWIFKRKIRIDVTAEKYKAILFVQNFKQNYSVDYFDTHAPMAQITTSRFLMA